MYTIDNIPLKTFCILVDDPSKSKKYGIETEVWNQIQAEYSQLNPTPDYTRILEAFKKVVKESVKLSGHVSLLKIIKGISDDWEPYFKKIKLRYSGDPLKDLETLSKEISKAEQKEKIYDAQLKKIEKQVSEEQEKQVKERFDIQKINQAIASLEVSGATINDYDTLTLSKYEALGTIYKQNERSNKR